MCVSRHQPTPICYSAGTGVAAFDVLVALCTDCVQNLRLVVDTLIEMYYSGESWCPPPSSPPRDTVRRGAIPDSQRASVYRSCSEERAY